MKLSPNMMTSVELTADTISDEQIEDLRLELLYEPGLDSMQCMFALRGNTPEIRREARERVAALFNARRMVP
jgi:hypothetical protein